MHESSYLHKETYQSTVAFFMGQFIIELFERGFLGELSEWMAMSKQKISWRFLQKYYLEGYRRLIALNGILA